MSFHYDIVKLNSVADIFSGYAFNAEEMNPNDGIPLIKIKNVNNKKVSKECDSFLNSDAFEKKYEKYFLKSDDFLVAMTGQGSVGRIGKMRGNNGNSYLVNQRVGIVRVKPELAEPEYIYQCLARDEIENIYFNLAMGAGQPNLSPKDIGNLSIPLPPFPIQQKIAAILSRYDDLIENNLKQIKLLEEMAQITYQEWFVRLKFPNHENTPIDEKTGLPVGWHFGKFSDLIELQRGFDLPVQDREEGLIPVIASTGVIGFHSSYKVKAPGVVTGRSGTIGQVMFVDSDFWPLNTTLWVKTYKSCKPIFVKHFLEDFNLESLCGGSAVPSLDRKSVHIQKIVIPPVELMKDFEVYASPHYKTIKILRSQNQLLKEARDILLPRLMTGKITVGADLSAQCE